MAIYNGSSKINTKQWYLAMNANNWRFILYFGLANVLFVSVVNELTTGQPLWLRTWSAIAAATGTTIVFTILRNRTERAKAVE
jgi:hypothetical protein